MKRQNIAFLLTLWSAMALAQTDYHITVQTEEPADIVMPGIEAEGRLYLYAEESHKAIDSAAYTGSQTVLQGKAETPQIVSICTDNGGTARLAFLILDATPTTVTVTSDSTTVTGSELNNRLSALNTASEHQIKALQDILMQINRLMRQYKSAQAIPADLLSPLQTRFADVMQRQRLFLHRLLASNRNNLIPVPFITMYSDLIAPDTLAAYLKTYPHRGNGMLKDIVGLVEAEERKATGAPFTDIALNDMAGKTVRLSDYVGKGNYVLVDFWASWCGPCRAEMPNVRNVYNRFHPKGFEIVGISLDSQSDDWRQATEQMGITWPQMSDLKGWKSEAATLYGVRSIPFTLLFDPDGKVVATGLRGESLMQKLEQVYEDKR